MSRFWSPVVGTLSPYVPGEQPKLQNLVKLNTNEHPYGPSPKVLDAIRAACDDALKLYPDPSSDRLRQAIADTVGAQPGQVFVGNGSDEVLAHVFLALLKHERPLRFPDITYSFYPVYCGLYGIQYETVPLTADFRIDVEDYLPGRAGPAGAIIFPNPNAPTGRALDAAEVERIVAGNPDASSSWMRPTWILAESPSSLWSPATTTCWSCRRYPSRARWRGCGSASPLAARRSSKGWSA